MPIHRGKDKNGPFYRWGESGKKYYYKPNNVESREAAHKKAWAQARAIIWSQMQAKKSHF